MRSIRSMRRAITIRMRRMRRMRTMRARMRMKRMRGNGGESDLLFGLLLDLFSSGVSKT